MNLVKDLAVILISAGLFTIISRVLKQPLVLGYIIAGFLVGPNISFFPGVSSMEAVDQWSEIGIIFLMFGLGLEFSFKKLLKVGSSALVTAGCKFLGVFILGFMVGQALGWSLMESIFLAGLLSMSSTTVVIKSYDEMGLKNKPQAGLVFGTLVVEDLIAILLMVLLSTMAVSNKFAGGEMLFNLGKLGFFLILWFLVGIYVIPTLLKKARPYINDEILLIVCIGLCFGMVSLAEKVGFSSALGAFVMGSILAETIESEHIEHLVSPIKDLFGAIFFVSVGMMISPAVIAQHWGIILLLVVMVYITHVVFSAAGAVLTGKGLELGLHTGFSLAQLGEFGFILAGVGVSLGVMRDFIYPVIIAVSVITTFTTPYMIRLAEPSYVLLCRYMPDSWLKHLGPTENVASDSGLETDSTAAERFEWKQLIKLYLLRILLYGVVILAISIGSRLYLEPLIDKVLYGVQNVMPGGHGRFLHNLITVAVTLLLMSPFLYGMGVTGGSINQCTSRLLEMNDRNKWPILGLILVRSLLTVGIVAGVIAGHFTLAGWTLVLVVAAGAVFVLIARYFIHSDSFLESRFFANLNEKELEAMRRAPVTGAVNRTMMGYNVKLQSVVIPADSQFVGVRLCDAGLRSLTGANILKVTRGRHYMTIPPADYMICPGDELLAVGTVEQLEQFSALVQQPLQESAGNWGTVGQEVSAVTSAHDFDVVPIVLAGNSFMTGKMLKNCRLREFNCMVISVFHDGKFILNPAPDFTFTLGDTVWVAGEKQSCEYFR